MVDRLLTRSIVALEAEGLVTLETLAVDGVRVRAHAGQAVSITVSITVTVHFII